MCYIPHHDKWYNLKPPLPWTEPDETEAQMQNEDEAVPSTSQEGPSEPKKQKTENSQSQPACDPSHEIKEVQIIVGGQSVKVQMLSRRQIQNPRPPDPAGLYHQLISAHGCIYVVTSARNLEEVGHFKLKHLQRYG